ncbi:Optic atrophy 3 protein [Mactra antiquata]
MPFPLVKLVALGFKQASKYVSEIAKRRAKENDRFKQMLIRGAGWYHVIQTKARLNVLGMGKVKEVKPLSEKAAIDLGVNIVGDIVMVLCALGIYYGFENRPGSKHKEREEEERVEEMRVLKEAVMYQSDKLDQQAERIKELERVLGAPTIFTSISDKVKASMSDNEKVNTKS